MSTFALIVVVIFGLISAYLRYSYYKDLQLSNIFRILVRMNKYRKKVGNDWYLLKLNNDTRKLEWIKINLSLRYGKRSL